MELRKTSTLLGCGCAAIITVFMLCVVAVTWFGYRSGKEMERLALDPEAAGERVREVVARGELDAGGARALWVARRGDIEIHGEHLGGGPQILVDGEPVVEVDYDDDGGDRPTAGGPRPALLTVISLECEDQRWERIAVWFALDPAPGVPAAEVDWSGTPADPEAIADFLGRLELCG